MYRECYLCGEKLTQEEIENYKDCCAGCWIDEYTGDDEQLGISYDDHLEEIDRD